MLPVLSFPFSEHERSPHGNSTSDFDTDLFLLIGMPFCVGSVNITRIGPPGRTYEIIMAFDQKVAISRKINDLPAVNTNYRLAL